MAIPIPQIPETPPSGAYLVNTLRSFDHAEHHSMLVHLTGRKGDSQCDDGQITWLSADRRLSKILAQRTIRAFPMFGIPQRAVCFTENSPAALEWLIAENRYEPFGLGFTKDTVFAHRGGPVLEVRGDEWPKTEFLPDELRARTKRFWPGAMAKKLGDTPLPWHISKPSEWSFEREWRVPLADFTFRPPDVQFIVCDTVVTRDRIARELDQTDGVMAARVSQIPCYWWDAANKRLVEA